MHLFTIEDVLEIFCCILAVNVASKNNSSVSYIHVCSSLSIHSSWLCCGNAKRLFFLCFYKIFFFSNVSVKYWGKFFVFLFMVIELCSCKHLKSMLQKIIWLQYFRFILPVFSWSPFAGISLYLPFLPSMAIMFLSDSKLPFNLTLFTLSFISIVSTPHCGSHSLFSPLTLLPCLFSFPWLF